MGGGIERGDEGGKIRKDEPRGEKERSPGLKTSAEIISGVIFVTKANHQAQLVLQEGNSS